MLLTFDTKQKNNRALTAMYFITNVLSLCKVVFEKLDASTLVSKDWIQCWVQECKQF